LSINPSESAVWGNLFSTDEMRELFSDRSQLQLMLDVEAALARAEASRGLIPPEIADTITKAARVENLNLEQIAQSTTNVGYPVIGLVRELGRIAGEQAARYIHLGATTQDILDTALALQIQRALHLIRADTIALARSFEALIRRFRNTPLAGRTHLKHAVPITFGFKCAVWAIPFVAHVERLDATIKRVCVAEFGGAAGTLAALGKEGPAVAEALARELGLGVPLIPWHVVRDGVAEVACVTGLISGSLGKFALDVALLMQTEVAEVSEPYEEGRGGSSTMPQKRNPVASEYILAATRGVHALVPMMLSAIVQDHERSTGPWQSEALALPQCLSLTAGALRQARAVADGLRVDVERMCRNLDADSGLIMAEALSVALMPKLGRAAAHHKVSQLCNAAIESRCSLVEVLRADSVVAACLSPQEIEKAAEPNSYLGSAALFAERVAQRLESLK
jgi:3-carboxy-cis,cis-muconate cycloisomerase